MASAKKLRIAMFPWLAFGHMIPFFELAKRIAQKGHQISFISTSRNIQRLPKIPPNLSPLMNFVSFTLPEVDNLPHDAEATKDLPLDEVQYLKAAFDKLQDSVVQFLQTSNTDWIIYDFAPYWLPSIAAKLGISQAFFSIFQAATLCFAGSPSAMINGEDLRTKPEDFTVPPKWVPFHSNIAFRLHEARKFFQMFDLNGSGVTDAFRVGSTMAGCDLIAVRSCLELDSEWLKLLGELNGKPVAAVGLLPPPASDSRDGSTEDNTWLTISEWLGKQNIGSVVYVALGSEVNPSQDELTELALGLELSWLPFFWALRKQHDSLELPDGFEERVKGRGVVWTTWAPQVRILAHEAVGASLTHSGFSSVIESLHYGLPLVMLPLSADQGLYARVFAEKKAGIEIKRDEEDGSFTRNSVAESLRLVILEEEGRIYRDKARELRVLFADEELQDQYIDKFVEFLQNHRQVSK